MKRTLTLITTLCLLLSLCAIGASAQKNHTIVTVTIAVKGELVATQVSVPVEDIDGDGVFTINDALYCAHEQVYEGGADAGYSYYTSEYGLSMSKLWGDESGAYGYYLNNTSCMSLADPVKNGDYITAFVYASSDWSDVYTYFDVSTKTVEVGEQIELTLMAAGYDESWNPITYPVKGATITVDGAPTGIVTDENGKATFKRNEIGTTVISAKSETQTLVPPVCSINVVKAETEAPEEEAGCGAIVGASLLALLPLAFLCTKKKEN
jgi:hypothetical protein